MLLLKEKLKAPPLPPCTVARPRLNDHFALNEQVRLLVVQAPPGYGKTTLLAERLPVLEQQASWLRLDDQDNQTHRFLAYWQAAMDTLLAPQVTLTPGDDSECIAHMERWLTELPEQHAPCRLVVDGFEHLANPEILTALAHWLRHQPPRLTLTLASRSRPALGLASLRLRGELEEIDLHSLAFDSEEAHTLCAEQLSFPPTRVSTGARATLERRVGHGAQLAGRAHHHPSRFRCLAGTAERRASRFRRLVRRTADHYLAERGARTAASAGSAGAVLSRADGAAIGRGAVDAAAGGLRAGRAVHRTARSACSVVSLSSPVWRLPAPPPP